MILVKNNKVDLFSERLQQWGYCNKGERLGSTLNTTRTSRHLEPRRSIWVSDGKLLRGKIMGKGDSGYTNLTGFLLKSGQDDQISRVENEESDQISGVGMFSKLIQQDSC